MDSQTISNDQFYNKHKKIVWIIEIVRRKKKNGGVKKSYATGFALMSKGLVLTCAHSCQLWDEKCTIKLRRLDEQHFVEAKIVYNKPKWDIVVLQINDDDSRGWTGGMLRDDDGSLYEGETLLCICNDTYLVGSCLVGRVAYLCPNIVNVQLDDEDKLDCRTYEPMSSILETPEHRVMGHFWHKMNTKNFPPNDDDQNYLAALAKEKNITFDPNLRNLHPYIPVIQISGFAYGVNYLSRYGVSNGVSTAGAPVFNVEGKVVGMITRTSMDDACAIHYSLLREVFEEVKKLLNSNLQVGGSKNSEALPAPEKGKCKLL